MQRLHQVSPLLAAFGFLLLLAGPYLDSSPSATPSMTFRKITPNMMVEDVNETITFYRDILGFDLVMTVPDSGRFDWALVRRGDVEVMFQARASLAEDFPQFKERPLGGALTLYIDLQGVDALYEQVHGQVDVVKDLQTTFYGTREFTIQDPNGFVLTFAEGGA